MRSPEFRAEQLGCTRGYDVGASSQPAREQRPAAVFRCHLDALPDEGVRRGLLIDPLAAIDVTDDRGGWYRKTFGPPGKRQVDRDALADPEDPFAIVDRIIKVDGANRCIG